MSSADSDKFLITTTAKPSHARKSISMLRNICPTNVDFVFLITEAEEEEARRALSIEEGRHIRVIQSDLSMESNQLHVSSYKFLPSLGEIAGFLAEREEYKMVSFVNGDIRLDEQVLGTIFGESCVETKLYGYSRWDYANEDLIGVYYHGIDLFSCSPRMMQHILSQMVNNENMRIGLPGWDYYLISLLRPDEFVYSTSLYLEHQLHESTCPELWQDNIQFIVGTLFGTPGQRGLATFNHLFSWLGASDLFTKVLLFAVLMPHLRKVGWTIGRYPYRPNSKNRMSLS